MDRAEESVVVFNHNYIHLYFTANKSTTYTSYYNKYTSFHDRVFCLHNSSLCINSHFFLIPLRWRMRQILLYPTIVAGNPGYLNNWDFLAPPYLTDARSGSATARQYLEIEWVPIPERNYSKQWRTQKIFDGGNKVSSQSCDVTNQLCEKCRRHDHSRGAQRHVPEKFWKFTPKNTHFSFTRLISRWDRKLNFCCPRLMK